MAGSSPSAIFMHPAARQGCLQAQQPVPAHNGHSSYDRKLHRGITEPGILGSRSIFDVRVAIVRDLAEVRCICKETLRGCGITNVVDGEPTVNSRHCIGSILRKRPVALPTLTGSSAQETDGANLQTLIALRDVPRPLPTVGPSRSVHQSRHSGLAQRGAAASLEDVPLAAS